APLTRSRQRIACKTKRVPTLPDTTHLQRGQLHWTAHPFSCSLVSRISQRRNPTYLPIHPTCFPNIPLTPIPSPHFTTTTQRKKPDGPQVLSGSPSPIRHSARIDFTRGARAHTP